MIIVLVKVDAADSVQLLVELIVFPTGSLSIEKPTEIKCQFVAVYFFKKSRFHQFVTIF